MKMRGALLWLLSGVVLVPACGWQGGQEDAFGGPTGAPAVATRRGTVVIDGCSLTGNQTSTLDSSPVKKLVRDVIFLCFTLDTTGAGKPSDAPSRAAFGKVAAHVKALGYSVKVGVSLSADSGGMYGSGTTEGLFQSWAWTSAVVTTVSAVAPLGDGVDLDFQNVPDSARDAVTALVARVASVVHPSRSVELFVPPSVTVPSDLPDGDAFDLSSLGPLVDRVRVMTLDYSTGTLGGPTIDSGWALDAVTLAASETSTPLDVSVPLYGWDFASWSGAATPVTFAQASRLAASSGAAITRSLGGDLSFTHDDANGEPHGVWFDDAQATLLTLAALSPDVLSTSVGVLYYGLGDRGRTSPWDDAPGAASQR